jgi:hypothetical protein
VRRKPQGSEKQRNKDERKKKKRKTVIGKKMKNKIKKRMDWFLSHALFNDDFSRV